MFVLRDFDDRGLNFDRIMQQIKMDIANIWAKIYKPDKFKDKLAEDFFDFEFAMLPHKVYQEQEFDKKVDELKTRFAIKSENSIFPKGSGGEHNVPMDGL